MSFLRKSLSRVLWTSRKGIVRDAMRFQVLGAILYWLAGWLGSGTNGLDLMCKCFLGRLELKTLIFFSAIERKEFSCALLLGIQSGKPVDSLCFDNSQKIHVIMPVFGNKEDSIWLSSLIVLFNG